MKFFNGITMKGKKVIMVASALAFIFVVLVLVSGTDAATIYVPDQEATLQGAINNASSGDTIHINTTTLTLTSPVEVNKTVIIEGNGTSNTIIDGNSAVFMVLNITAENVTIRNLTVTGATDRGINISANATLTPNNFTITNCYIHNNTNYGIYWASGTYGRIVNCIIENNGDGGDNEGGLYITKDMHGAVVGNTFRNNNQNGIYSTENANYDTTVYHYNNFRNNTLYAVETASGGTVRAQYNCWYNDTAGAWGGVPNATGVDNVSAGVIATPYYNGSVVDSGVTLIQEGTNTYSTVTSGVTIVYHEAGHTYNPWLMAANFSAVPIGTPSSHYTTYATTYGAFNLSGRGQTEEGLATGDWLNLSFYYTASDGLVKGMWHWNGTAWVAPSSRGINTTDAGGFNGYVWANFTANPTSPVLIYLNYNPVARFDWSPTEPSVGETVTFDASDSTDTEDGSMSTYHWDFGDDTTGVGEKPTHTYDEAGDYVVKLTITDYAGGSATVKHTVTVTGAAGGGVSPGSGDYDLTVTVVDGSGNTVSGATVNLYYGTLLATATTDSSGVAVFNDVEGIYTVTASKSGYVASSTYVTVTSNTYVTLVLSAGAGIAEAEILGFAMPIFFAISVLVIAFIAMLIVAFAEGGNYKKYWWIPALLGVLSLMIALFAPILWTTIAFNFWLVIASLVVTGITVLLCLDYIKKTTTRW